MDQEFIKQFKDALVESLLEAKDQARTASPKPVVQAIFNTKIDLLEKLVIFTSKSIKEEGIDMNKMKAEIKAAGGKIQLETLLMNKRGGKLEPKIKELAEGLKVGEAIPVDGDSISWGHFSAKVYNMRSKEKLPMEYLPVKKGEQFFLARFSKETIAEREANRKRRKGINGNN